MKSERFAFDSRKHPLFELFAEFFQARPSAALDQLTELGQSCRHGDRVSGKEYLLDKRVRPATAYP